MNTNQTCIRTITDEHLLKNARKNIKSNQKIFDTQSKIFSLLGNEVRLKIIHLLLRYEKLCVCDFTDIMGVNQSPISQHLRKLKDAQILENKRDGLTIFYFISKKMKGKLQLILEV